MENSTEDIKIMKRTANKRKLPSSSEDSKANKKVKIEESLDISESGTDVNMKDEELEAVKSNAIKQVNTRRRLRVKREQFLLKPEDEKDFSKDADSKIEDLTKPILNPKFETDGQNKPKKKSRSDKKNGKKQEISDDVKESTKKRTTKARQSTQSQPTEADIGVVREPENSKKYIGAHCSISGM